MPPPELATTSRPDQITRLAGRERKTTSIRTIQDMTSIETITRHSDLASEASPERDTAVPQNRAPGIRTLVFERSPESATTLDPATPAFIPGVPYRQAFQEAAPESRVRGHVTYADAARSPPLTIYMPAPSITPPRLSPSQKTGDNRPAPTSTAVAGQTPEGTGAGHAEFNRPTPELLPSSRSPQQHASESRPTPTTSIEAGRQLEGTGVDQDELKLRGAMQGEKILFPLPIPGTITCDLCRPPVSWRRKKSNHRDALRHMQELHDARTVAAFRCTRCGYATTTLHAGNRHLSRSCTGVRALEEAPQEVGPTELRDDGTLVLLWPARPSSCPIQDCTFVTSASGVTVATSLDHHLARRHGTQMGRRLWKCTYCNKTMAGLETREHRCGGPRPTKVAGPKRPRVRPPVPAPAQQKVSSLTSRKRQDEQRRTTAAREDLPGGDRYLSTDEGEDHDEDSLPPPDWTPPRDDTESAGEREDDANMPSLPDTARPEPRDQDLSAGRGEDHDSLPPDGNDEVRATPRPGTTMRPGPESPPTPSNSTNPIEELSPTLVAAIRHIDTSGGSTGGIYVNERVQHGLNGVGPDDSIDLFATPTRGEPRTVMGSPMTPHTTPTEDNNNSPPSPVGPIHTPDISPTGSEGPPHQDQPVAAEIDSIWDIPGEGQQTSWPVPSSDTPPAPTQDTDNDDGGIPQPGWQDRMPEVTPPRASGDTRVSRVNQEGDSPEAGEDSLAVDTHDDEETVTRAAFSARWKEAFLGCHRGNLDQTMEEFTKELLKVANRLLSRTSVAKSNNNSARRRAPPADTNEPDPAPRSSAGIQQRRRRNQHRHQQRRVRRQQHHRPEDASKLQRLYGRYPRKALRKVLGEESPYYSGGRDRLCQYIAETYHSRTVSRDQVAEARRLYDNCSWEPPTDEELEALQSPPSADEVLGRLRRTVNTSPGMDRIEWRHLKVIDRTGSLLQTVLSAVHALGIPSSWKQSRTIMIHKKGDTDDPSNFRPISLLSTLYKLYSGILASRLTKTATSHGWLSAEQKGFLPGVRGIQEHTFLLQTAIDEAKKNYGDLSIAWLDLTNAFGAIPHPVLGQLFESLPIPDLLRQHLTDIYTDNHWEFVCEEGSVEAQPVSGVRQGDGLSPIIFNLASEPLVRAAAEGQGIPSLRQDRPEHDIRGRYRSASPDTCRPTDNT